MDTFHFTQQSTQRPCGLQSGGPSLQPSLYLGTEAFANSQRRNQSLESTSHGHEATVTTIEPQLRCPTQGKSKGAEVFWYHAVMKGPQSLGRSLGSFSFMMMTKNLFKFGRFNLNAFAKHKSHSESSWSWLGCKVVRVDTWVVISA